MRALKDCL